MLAFNCSNFLVIVNAPWLAKLIEILNSSYRQLGTQAEK